MKRKISECINLRINLGNYQHLELVKYGEEEIEYNNDEERINKDAQLEIYRLQINDLKKWHAEALVKNKEFGKKLEQMPARMAELARENKLLVKETAFTHYNLGVFYAKNKEYSRALESPLSSASARILI